MTTLQELMLNLSTYMGETRTGVITAVTSTTITDSDDPDTGDRWKDGVLFLDGASSGDFARRITNYAAGVFTFGGDPGSPGVGEDYTVASSIFGLTVLKSAINRALREIKIVGINTAHEAAAGECTLMGVSHVLRVDVDDVRNHHWQEVGGKLVFGDTAKAGELYIQYLKAHDPLDELTDELDASVDPEYVKYAAAVVLWRDHIRSKVGMDDQVITQLFNEAKSYEAQYKALHEQRLPGRDAHLARW